jgi:hypothetical protein
MKQKWAGGSGMGGIRTWTVGSNNKKGIGNVVRQIYEKKFQPRAVSQNFVFDPPEGIVEAVQFSSWNAQANGKPIVGEKINDRRLWRLPLSVYCEYHSLANVCESRKV